MNNLSLTKVQVFLLKKTFNTIDLDGNGVLDREEMTELFRKVFPENGEEDISAAVDECFTLYDDDENGVIDFDEFCNGLANALMQIGNQQSGGDEEQQAENSEKKTIDM